MIWLVLFIISGVLFTVGLIKDSEMFLANGLALLMVFCIPTAIMLGEGVTDYPCYISEKQEMIMLESGIDKVRDAQYKVNQVQNAVVSGSIENFKQSTVLSEYIKDFYVEKAIFNKNLSKAQYHEKSTLMFWIADGAFIDSRIHEIELLK